MIYNQWLQVGRNFSRAILRPDPAVEARARQAGEAAWGTKLADVPFPEVPQTPPVLGPRSARQERTRVRVERLLAITR